jgi:hypothetical protein
MLLKPQINTDATQIGKDKMIYVERRSNPRKGDFQIAPAVGNRCSLLIARWGKAQHAGAVRDEARLGSLDIFSSVFHPCPSAAGKNLANLQLDSSFKDEFGRAGQGDAAKVLAVALKAHT